MEVIGLLVIYGSILVMGYRHSRHLETPTVKSGHNQTLSNYHVVTADYTPYSKKAPGRHVCMSTRSVLEPVKTKEKWCKPIQKRYSRLCKNNQICHGLRLVYETAYRDVITSKTTQQTTYVCCPGWVQVSPQNYGCTKPMCKYPCQNGGACTKPNVCTCKQGFRGKHCELDVNECKEQKPCDQLCHNIPGSYFCTCRTKFKLSANKHSCEWENGATPALEAKDLELDMELKLQLWKLESIHEQKIEDTLSNLSKKVAELEKERNLEIKMIENRLDHFEQRQNYLIDLINLYRNKNETGGRAMM